MRELFYPTIDLFTYDLKNALNSDTEKIALNTQNFLAKLPDNVRFNDNEREQEYLELTTPRKPKLNPANKNLEGYYYPVRLHDVYGLQIDCSVDNLTEPQATDSFALIKTEIESKSQPDSLTIGQTWFVSGWLTEHPHQDTEAIAKSCYQNLFKEGNWQRDLYETGTFFQGDLFELWQSQSEPRHHVVIVLFPSREMMEKAAVLAPDWMGLLGYRHKITWAYGQSRSIKEALIKHYRKVEKNAEIIEASRDRNQNYNNLLQLLNNIQDILNQYTIDLLKLAFQKQVIDINLVNYQTRLAIIKQKAAGESKLKCLDKFSNLAEKKYLLQIDKDIENMQLGLRLLENNINAIRSGIELQKAERESSFQTLVTIIGTAIAGASLISEEAKECTVIFPADSWICKTPLLKSLAVPIVLILLFGAIGWLFRQVLKRS